MSSIVLIAPCGNGLLLETASVLNGPIIDSARALS
ncbi:hypothetical protein N601_30565 [Rhodococcus erythropolis DN1]|nr:hypothetical protein N601_30565 [Rhodococcus erythropolis DN1]